MVNLGLTEFKAGAKGTEFEAEIESIDDATRGDGKTLKLSSASCRTCGRIQVL